MSETAMARLATLIDDVAEQVQTLRRENAQLKKKNAELLEELEGVRQDCSEKVRQVDQLRQERNEIKSRVSRIKAHVADLERPMKKTALDHG